jgi:hypothetical protein
MPLWINIVTDYVQNYSIVKVTNASYNYVNNAYEKRSGRIVQALTIRIT